MHNAISVTFKSDVDAPQSNVQTHISNYFLSGECLVLGLDTNCIGIPSVAKVTDQYHRSNK